ncbi:hypothetical protein BN341_3480 [Helicobacter heilmannii ASB1.4]|uniref:Uncharacterized protein n=1 Tax=Helicobacter heilmannii TaxID=35817 RepID=A0A0K2Y5I3_HELHE|nr:hypothetical protein BN341_3440 [Helicobacter heilmannii ASB1.4]CCM73350.1 hypothetical protein BN341_3480 [Helicobacter heilmannii ASB1.4]CRI34103.1 hypothetical protein HHE01_09490 [Helicobacter heilmannii]
MSEKRCIVPACQTNTHFPIRPIQKAMDLLACFNQEKQCF